MSAGRAGRAMPWHGWDGAPRVLARLTPRRVIALVPRRHAADLSWTLTSQVAGIALKMLVLLILARALGAAELGVFVAAKALIGFFVALSGWGYGELIIRNVSRDPSSLGLWWGNALVAVVASGTVFGVVVALIGPIVLPDIAVSMLLVLATTQLVLGRLHGMTIEVYRARKRMAQAATVTLIPDALFLIGAASFVWLASGDTAARWVTWHAGSMLLAVLVVLVIAVRSFGGPRPNPRHLLAQLPISTHFAVARATSGLNRNLDSVLIARLASVEVLGIVSAAWVIVGAAHVPFAALGKTLLPRLFELGDESHRQVREFAGRTLLVCVAYGAIAGVILALCAPMVPALLGADYADAVTPMRWMAIAPVLHAFTSIGSMTLTAIDRPQDRTFTITGVVVVHVVLAFWLLPRYAWAGAVATTLVSEFALAAGYWWFVRLRTRQNEAQTTGVAA